MSSDWKDPNDYSYETLRQGTRTRNEDSYDTPHLQGQQDQVAVDPGTDPLLHYEDDIEESPELLPTRMEVLGGTMRRLSPVLAPLLFGGVTFLFILPFVLNNRAYLSTTGSLPTGLILLAIGLVLLVFALGQGIMLYYAGTNDVLWSLGMICGFSLFLLTGCFAIFGPLPSIILLAVLLLLGFLFVRLYIRPTPEGQVDIVEAFGKHSRTLFPGLNFVAPWEKIVYKLDTREKVWSCSMQKVPVSRSEEVQLAATITYQLMPEDAHLAALYVSNWEKSLQELFVATIQSVVGELSPEDFIAWTQTPRSRQAAGSPNNPGRWDRINTILVQRMQDQVAHWGVQIDEVHIRDVALVPHIPLMAEANPPASPQPVHAGVARSPAQIAPAQPNQPPAHPQVQSRKPELSPSPAPPPAGTPTPAISKVDMLKDAYEAVRTERITDPITIREIAAHFESIANDPEESQNVDFDAARAARTLLERAALIEEQIRADAEYNDDTQPDWSMAPTQRQ
jgi:hypothetical protein